MSFLWKDFFSVLFFTLKKNAVEIVHELGYFTLRTKNLLKKMKFLKVQKMSKKIIAGFGEVMLRLCPPGKMRFAQQ